LRRFLDTPQIESIQGTSMIHRRRQEAIEQINASLGCVQRRIFTRLLASSRDFITLRENIKYRLMEGYARVRHVFMQMGGDLTATGILEKATDVFFLTPSEVLSLNRGEVLARHTKKLILERKAQHVRWESQDSPGIIGDDGRELMRHEAAELTGIGCSPGTAEGVARVLFDPAEADTLQPGEILVAPHTDPGWTPLFLSCKAVVTEIGGFLSHGATVAREYGIPAVFNLAKATSKIHTGDFVRVDGAKGRVTICHRANERPKASHG
jgi:pyruvate,water dikinase